MKKLIRSYSVHPKPVRLYLDDLEEIVNIMKESCEQVDIEVGEYHLDSVDELPKMSQEVFHQMEISSPDPYFSLDLDPSGIRLVIARDTPSSRGILEKVNAVLVRRGRWFAPLLNTPMFVVALAMLFVLIFVPLLFGFSPGPSITYQVLLNVAWFGVFLYVAYNCVKNFTTIVARRRIESPAFFKRNADKIIVGVVTSIITTLAYTIIANAFKWFR
jgi:hypothetical protein